MSPRDNKVTTIANDIPKIPKKLPVLEVSGEESPLNAIINNMPVTKYNDAVILAEIISFYSFCTSSTFFGLPKNHRRYLLRQVEFQEFLEIFQKNLE